MSSDFTYFRVTSYTEFDWNRSSCSLDIGFYLNVHRLRPSSNTCNLTNLNISGALLQWVIAFLVVFNIIVIIFTVCKEMLKIFLLIKLGLFNLSGLEDLYIKPFTERDPSLLKNFCPQTSLTTVIPCTKLQLRKSFTYAVRVARE